MNNLRIMPGLAAALGVVSSFAAFAAPPDWLLMSRHGECFEITPVLVRKFDGLPAITTPEHFIEEMRRRGLAVKATRNPDGVQDVVLIEVAERELSLLFTRRARCQAVSPGPR